MWQYIKFVILFLYVIGLMSCQKQSEIVAFKLNGNWVLDSISHFNAKMIQTKQGEWVVDCKLVQKVQNGKFESSSEQFLSFKNNNSYTNYRPGGCLPKYFKGKYFVLDNPNRGLLTLALVPDVDFSNKDTFRVWYKNWDILKLNNNELILISETQSGKTKCNKEIDHHFFFNVRLHFKRYHPNRNK